MPPRWLFLKVETDEGLTGWGEPVVEGHASTVSTAVSELSGLLLGADPLRIEDLWQSMYRGYFYRGGPILMSALAGVDQALWDIKGKFYGAPAYALLGGACRDRVRVYSWIGGDRPADVVAAAREKVEAGFDAVKMNATEELHYIDSLDRIDAVVERVAALRDAFGKSLSIAVDFHGRVHKTMARQLAAELAPYRLMFIEEPVLPENNEALRDIARCSPCPIAVGERMYSRWDFKRVLTEGYADILQPDLSHAGGLSECRKIASMAEGFDTAVAPHCPLGPIALAACLQLDAVSPNVFIQEQSLGIHYNRGSDLLDYLEDPTVFAYENGSVALPTGAGLGVTVNEQKVRAAAAAGHDWKNPRWRNTDGTVAEW